MAELLSTLEAAYEPLISHKEYAERVNDLTSAVVLGVSVGRYTGIHSLCVVENETDVDDSHILDFLEYLGSTQYTGY